MDGRRAIVISVDGLRASALGAYGNTWNPTPAFDDLASKSRVVEWMWCDSSGAADPLRPGGCGPVSHDGMLPRATIEIWRQLAAAGASASLVTDDAAAAEAAVSWFAEICCVDGEARASAAEISDTALARLFAVAAEFAFGEHAWLEPKSTAQAADHARLMWIHARGFHGPWDAPLSVRAHLLDEGDPPPPTFLAPPRREATNDHDEYLMYRAAYAAQTIVLDHCVGGLLRMLADRQKELQTLLVLIGSRGFALGEHGVVGGDRMQLYNETLHVPCLLMTPGADPAPVRWRHLARTIDLVGTLVEWMGLAVPSETRWVDLLSSDDANSWRRQFLTAWSSDGEGAIRTRAWMLRRLPSGQAGERGGVELYAKPDDRWEANEVADRCGDVAERLLAVLDHAGRDAASAARITLDSDLTTPRH
jgi:arylsulfatase A-like enzyme